MSETLKREQDVALTTRRAIRELELVTALINNPATDRALIPELRLASERCLSKLIGDLFINETRKITGDS